jgi:hypothetical protein
MQGAETVTSVPAAWYPDPAGSLLLRWWDGDGWTTHTVDPAAPSPAVEAPAVEVPAVDVPAPRVAVAVDPIEPMAYVPMAGFGSRSSVLRAPVAATYAGPSGSTLTVWVWLMAAFPVLQVVAAVIITSAFPDVSGGVLRYVFFTAAVIANVALAGRDAALLERRGYTAPRTRWAVIPLVYLIIRTVRVGRLSLWPLLVWAVTELVLIALVVLAVLLPLFLEWRADAGYVDAGAPAVPYPDAVPLSPQEREWELTQAGMEETLLQDFSAAGLRVESVDCAPLTSTAPGTIALCVIDAETGLLEVNAQVTGPEDLYTAFVVNGGRSLG